MKSLLLNRTSTLCLWVRSMVSVQNNHQKMLHKMGRGTATPLGWNSSWTWGAAPNLFCSGKPCKLAAFLKQVVMKAGKRGSLFAHWYTCLWCVHTWNFVEQQGNSNCHMVHWKIKCFMTCMTLLHLSQAFQGSGSTGRGCGLGMKALTWRWTELKLCVHTDMYTQMWTHMNAHTGMQVYFQINFILYQKSVEKDQAESLFKATTWDCSSLFLSALNLYKSLCPIPYL